MLITLLSDYLTKPSVRKAYMDAPRRVLREYGVNLADLALGIEHAVVQEVRVLISKGPKIKPLGWGIPSKAVEVQDFAPHSEAPGKKFTLTVDGKNFNPQCEVAVSLDGFKLISPIGKTRFKDAQTLEADFSLSTDDYYVGVVLPPAQAGADVTGDVLLSRLLSITSPSAKKKPGKSKSKRGMSKR